MPFSKTSLTTAFRNKNYRKFFIYQLFSYIGTWVQVTAQAWLVYRLTGSAFFLGAVSFAASIPALFLAPVAGVVADNYKRQNILIFTQTICVIQGLATTILYFTGQINEWHIFYLSLFLGFANAFDMTARQSFVPQLIDNKEDLTNAIALNSAMYNSARMLGPAVAGFMIALTGEGICFLINTVSYVPILAFIMILKVPDVEIEKKTTSMFNDFKEGLQFAWDHPALKALLMMVGTFSFFGATYSNLLPIFSDQIFNSGAEGLGIITSFAGVGAVLAGIFLASRKKVIGIKILLGYASIYCSIALMLFGLSKSFLLSCLLIMIAGFSFIIVFAGSNILFQALTPERLRGRVLSLFAMMLMGMYPLGSLAIGFIAQILSAPLGIIIGASICLLVGIYFNYKVPSLTKDAIELLDEQKKVQGTIPNRVN